MKGVVPVMDPLMSVTEPALAMAEPMFRLRDVHKVYPGTEALAGISLDILRGETVALVGPSGAGKTTLLNILGAVIPADCGEVYIDGCPAGTLRPGRDLARRVGVMYQQFALVDQLPVIHNVLAGRLGEWGLFRSLLSLIVPQEAELARRALARVGIAEKIHERTSRLSGGEQQRVALARLLVQSPRAIIADEPVSSVDPARAEDLIKLLTKLSREGGHTLVASLHSVEQALTHFSRIIALKRGRVVFDRPASEVTDEDLARLFRLEGEGRDGTGDPLA